MNELEKKEFDDKNIEDGSILEKIKNGMLKCANTMYVSAKKLYKQTLKEVTFFAKTSIFYIVSSPLKTKLNKMFTGILDEKNNTLYIKASKIILYKEHFVKNSLIKEDNEEKIYQIEKVDFKNQYDYLFKVKRKYQTISCYKIVLKEYTNKK